MQNRLQTIAVIIAFAAVMLITIGSISGLRAPRDGGPSMPTGSGTVTGQGG